MKFERIQIGAYGRLSNFDTGDAPLPQIVCICGPNEAGKSTLFHFLRTLLYGFSPARRDSHPHHPWAAGDIDGMATIRLDGGGEVAVHRRLLSSPWCEVNEGGRIERIRNQPVPWTAHIPTALYESVYALTIADLNSLEAETWRSIQNRLLGALGAEDVRPAHEVADELEADAARLCRPDRRGQPAANKLIERRTELRTKRREARDRDEELRGLEREISALQEERRRLRETRIDLEAVRERGETLYPIRSTLGRIRELEAEAGDPNLLDGLPERPAEALDGLEEECALGLRELESLQQEFDQINAVAEMGEDADRTLLSRASQIRTLVTETGSFRDALLQMETLRERSDALQRDCEQLARELLTVPWGEMDLDRLRACSVAELRSGIRSYRRSRERLQEVQAELTAIERLPAGAPSLRQLGGPSILAVSAIAVVIAGVLRGSAALIVIGALLAIGAAVWFGVAIIRRSDAARRERDLQTAISAREEADAEVRRHVREVRRILEPLPVAADLLEEPDHELPQTIHALQQAITAWEGARSDLSRRQEWTSEVTAKLHDLTAEIGWAPSEEFMRGVAELDRALDEALDRRRRVEEAESALPKARGRIDEAFSDLGAIKKRRAELEARLREIGGEDLELAAEAATRRQHAHQLATTLREELEREHPDLDDLIGKIRRAEKDGEEWTQDERAMVDLKERLKTIVEAEGELADTLPELASRRNELSQETTLDMIDGEIAALEERLGEIVRQRDQLAVLAAFVRAADRRFRDEHQPDVLRLAGVHLGRISGGRYDRLYVAEEAGEETLLIRGPEYPRPIEVRDPVSTGTRHQVYLALRLAIVDHLDREGERLPLFIDEGFVSWDAIRFQRGLDVLVELGEARQIFLFTCHDHLAREMPARGAYTLELEGPSPHNDAGRARRMIDPAPTRPPRNRSA